MGKFRLTKFLFLNKTTRVFDGVLVRFYEQIISGVWCISILMPIQAAISHKVAHTAEPHYLGFCIFFILASILFIFSSIAIPRIRHKSLRLEIQQLIKRQKINASQKLEILEILKDALACKDFFSKEGFWQFIMSNFFNFAVVSFYFGAESLVEYLLDKTSNPMVSAIFFFIFGICIFLEWACDVMFTRSFLVNGQEDSFNFERNERKKLVITIMSIIGRDSFSSSISQIILEDVIDDILAILSIQSKDSDSSAKPKQLENQNVS